MQMILSLFLELVHNLCDIQWGNKLKLTQQIIFIFQLQINQWGIMLMVVDQEILQLVEQKMDLVEILEHQQRRLIIHQLCQHNQQQVMMAQLKLKTSMLYHLELQLIHKSLTSITTMLFENIQILVATLQLKDELTVILVEKFKTKAMVLEHWH